MLIHQKGILLWESACVHICEYVCLWLCLYVCVRYPGYFRTCACLYPCAHPALVIRLASRIPDIAASRLIRAGIQPPWLHLTISHRATYSIISCLNWRALLSLTQADRKFPFISCKKKKKKKNSTQTKQASYQNSETLWLQAEGVKLRHRRASNLQQTKDMIVFLWVCQGKKTKTCESLFLPGPKPVFPSCMCVYFIPVITNFECVRVPLSECVYLLSSTLSHWLLTFYGFLFINWKHDGVLSGPDGWSRRIEKAISFTGITACQAVNTHCFMCLQAKMEQLSLLLGSRITCRHTRTCARTHPAHRRQEEGSNNDQLKSVIHYCQVHLTLSLLKTGLIGGRRSKNLISKQLWLVTFGINRHFPSSVITSYLELNYKWVTHTGCI